MEVGGGGCRRVLTCAAFLCSTITILVSQESLNSCIFSIITELEASPAADDGVLQSGVWGVQEAGVWGAQETGFWGAQEAGVWGAQEAGVWEAQEAGFWGAQEAGVWGAQEADIFMLEDSFSGMEESLPRERNERSKEMLSSSEGVSRQWSAPWLGWLSCDCT